MKKFPCKSFGTKSEYFGFNKESWPVRTHALHLQQVSKYKDATSASQFQAIEKAYGVRYSELLRLPYFDIIEFHVIDPMHNLLLGTGKYVMNLWKESNILSRADLEDIQDEVNSIKVPSNIGRITFKIGSNVSGFTADQWRNWICVYSLFCLKGKLPTSHYQCWSKFVDAFCLLLQPSISKENLIIADEKLLDFCNTYQTLYGKENCTPNMHMHFYLTKSIENFCPVYAFWCFPFERYNGVLGTFQKNWISPEMQMTKKILVYQDLLCFEASSTLPPELLDFFYHHIRSQTSMVSVGEGSLEQSHVDGYDLLKYKAYISCPVSDVDASEHIHQYLSRRCEGFF